MFFCVLLFSLGSGALSVSCFNPWQLDVPAAESRLIACWLIAHAAVHPSMPKPGGISFSSEMKFNGVTGQLGH